MKLILIAGSLLFALTSPTLAKCKRLSNGFDSASWELAGGTKCTMHFQGGNRHVSIVSIEIFRPPKHGTAAWNGSIAYAEVTYKPAPGYKGPDDFVLTISTAFSEVWVSTQSTRNKTYSITVD